MWTCSFLHFYFFGCCGFESWPLHCASLGEVSPKPQFSYLHNGHINRHLREWLSADSGIELWNSNPGLTTYKQCNLMQVIYSHHAHLPSRDDNNIDLIGLLGGLSE